MLLPVIRTSFAFNLATIHAIEALASKWDVSKSEAVRKAVLMVNEGTPAKMTPLQALQALRKNPIPTHKAEAYLRELREIRKASSKKRWNKGWGKYLKETRKKENS